MNKYRVEFLGSVPYGLTRNDVVASAISLLAETGEVEAHNSRLIGKSMVSVIVTFHATDVIAARKASGRVQTGINGFSCDVVGLTDMGAVK